ncbi:glutathione S-transferase family protein [Ensifer sp. MPMI2T]|nr:glutathione S-transferase family protein [Ensifer sp. MPMI2T]
MDKKDTSITLFYSPGACSIAPHMALEETGLQYGTTLVSLEAGVQNSPEFRKVNPKGRVPALRVGSEVITENPAILRYIAGLVPAGVLLPKDPIEQARCDEWLAWCASSVHVSYAHVRRPERYADTDGAIANVVDKGRRSSRDVWRATDEKLAGKQWAAGSSFSIADLYLLVFWLFGRSSTLGFDMEADFPNWDAHAKRVTQRPAVRTVFEREGVVLP